MSDVYTDAMTWTPESLREARIKYATNDYAAAKKQFEQFRKVCRTRTNRSGNEADATGRQRKR